MFLASLLAVDIRRIKIKKEAIAYVKKYKKIFFYFL